MRFEYKNAFILFLLGIFVVLLVDTLGAMASATLNFNYGYLSVITLAAYIYFPYLIAKTGSKIATILYAIMIGLFDATLGFYISEYIRRRFGAATPLWLPSSLVIIPIISILGCSLLGMLSWWLARRKSKSIKIRESIDDLLSHD